MWRAKEPFYDILDNYHLYAKGAVYPRKGYTPSPARVAELSGNANRMGRPLIESDEAGKKPAPKKKGKK